MTKGDDANTLARRVNEISDYIAELKQERAELMWELSQLMTITDVGHLTRMHATTAGRIIGQAKAHK